MMVADLIQRFAAVFDAACDKDMKRFNAALANFNALYRRATIAEQGEYHHWVASVMGRKDPL